MTISLSQLESHLWESANILRGSVDAADFKSYVFPLLFFKRISDVHDEEHKAALKAFDGDEDSALFPENYGFQIPECCHWADVRTVATNVGQALQTALRGIEQANPQTLYGIHLLAPQGMAGFVLANGSMSSNQSREGNIRRSIIEADLVDCLVALASRTFSGIMRYLENLMPISPSHGTSRHPQQLSA